MGNKSNGKSFLIGTVVGGVVGAVTALLVAPKSGRELRADIAEQAQNVSQKTQDVARSVGAQTSEWVGKAKEAATAIAEKFEAYREGRKEETAEAADECAQGETDTADQLEQVAERELLEVK